MHWVRGRYDAPFKRYRDFSNFQILKNDNVVPHVILKIHTNQTPFFKNAPGRARGGRRLNQRILRSMLGPRTPPAPVTEESLIP